MKSILKLGIGSVMILFSSISQAEDSQNPYIVDQLISTMGDKHVQANAWATCAAVYEYSSEILGQVLQEKSQAKHMHEMSNGAKVAIAMTYINNIEIEGVSGDMLKKSFNSTFQYAKLAMQEMPKTIVTVISANFEKARGDQAAQITEMEAVFKAAQVCQQNAFQQQAYLESWRELATSGLLSLPQ